MSKNCYSCHVELTQENSYTALDGSIQTNYCKSCELIMATNATTDNPNRSKITYDQRKAMAEKGQYFCNKCNAFKPRLMFPNARNRWGVAYTCRACYRKLNRKHKVNGANGLPKTTNPFFNV